MTLKVFIGPEAFFIIYDKIEKRLVISDLSAKDLLPGIYHVQFTLDDSKDVQRYNTTIIVLEYQANYDEYGSSNSTNVSKSDKEKRKFASAVENFRDAVRDTITYPEGRTAREAKAKAPVPLVASLDAYGNLVLTFTDDLITVPDLKFISEGMVMIGRKRYPVL